SARLPTIPSRPSLPTSAYIRSPSAEMCSEKRIAPTVGSTLASRRLRTFGRDVLGEADRADGGQHAREQALALDERQGPQVVAGGERQIEGVERRGQLQRGAGDVRAAREQAALLQRGEARQAVRAVHDDL